MREKNSGFTLVELIVVISIIAVLMGILMPALAATRRIAKRTICKSNLHSLSLSFRMYLDDNKNVMPYIMSFPTLPSEDEKKNNVKPINIVLAKYLGDQKVLKCPADTYPPDEYHYTTSTYFAEEGSSYRYNRLFNTFLFQRPPVKLEGTGLPSFRGETIIPWAEFWILRDYYGFHGNPTSYGSDGTPSNWKSGSYMYLYADTLVADRERKK